MIRQLEHRKGPICLKLAKQIKELKALGKTKGEIRDQLGVPEDTVDLVLSIESNKAGSYRS